MLAKEKEIQRRKKEERVNRKKRVKNYVRIPRHLIMYYLLQRKIGQVYRYHFTFLLLG